MKCRRCNGLGYVAVRNDVSIGLASVMTTQCLRCDGLGVEDEPNENHQRCWHCGDYTDECRCAGY